MDSFYTKRHKINFVYNKNILNTQTTDNQDKIDKSITYQVDQNKSSVQVFNKLRDFSVDWATCDNTGSLATQYKVWEIEWDSFDIRLIPYLDIKPMYRALGGTLANANTITPQINKIVQVEDIEGESSEYYKKVLLNVSMYMTISDLYTTYEGKLNVLFINPRQFR